MLRSLPSIEKGVAEDRARLRSRDQAEEERREKAFAAAEATKALGDEDQLDPELLAADRSHDLLGELILLIPFEQSLVGQLVFDVAAKAVESDVQSFCI